MRGGSSRILSRRLSRLRGLRLVGGMGVVGQGKGSLVMVRETMWVGILGGFVERGLVLMLVVFGSLVVVVVGVVSIINW